MKVIIIPTDKAVYVDGTPLEIAHFEDLGIAPNVQAVHWDSGLKRGEVQYKTPAPTPLDEATFDAMFIHCVAHHENVDMDRKAAEAERAAKDAAHVARINAMAEAREAKDASLLATITKQAGELEALKQQVVKLTAGR